MPNWSDSALNQPRRAGYFVLPPYFDIVSPTEHTEQAVHVQERRFALKIQRGDLAHTLLQD
jgi:hypothetical protein